MPSYSLTAELSTADDTAAATYLGQPVQQYLQQRVEDALAEIGAILATQAVNAEQEIIEELKALTAEERRKLFDDLRQQKRERR